MDMSKLYTDFLKVVELISKTTIVNFVSYQGAYSSLNDGHLTIVTLKEKYEAPIMALLHKKYVINTKFIRFMDKYFSFKRFVFDSDRFEIRYTISSLALVLEDKQAINFLPLLDKDDDEYIVSIPYDDECDNDISLFLNFINTHIEDTSEKYMDVDIFTEFNTNEKPMDINIGDFFIRIAKSMFKTVTKGDVSKIRCFKYKDNDTLFLTTTTVNKKEFQIINVFNNLYLEEDISNG